MTGEDLVELSSRPVGNNAHAPLLSVDTWEIGIDFADEAIFIEGLGYAVIHLHPSRAHGRDICDRWAALPPPPSSTSLATRCLLGTPLFGPRMYSSWVLEIASPSSASSAPAAAAPPSPTEEKLEGKDGKDEPGRIREPASELDKLREVDRDPPDEEAAEGAPGLSPAADIGAGSGLPR